MKHQILHQIQHFALMGIVVLSATFVACNKEKKFSFKTPQEALNACHTELSKIKPLKTADIDRVGTITSTWLELQDSTLCCFMRDSTVKSDAEIVTDFFEVTDSFRTEIVRLALSEKRTLPEIVKLKVVTAKGRKEMMESKDYKAACEFYEKMNNAQLFPSLEKTLAEYEKLLTSTKSIKTEGQLHEFIRKEDQCFRSLLVFLKNTPQSKLQGITDKTSSLFDTIYRNAAADLENKINDRVMMYLTMRFNRRIIQNAEVCWTDIKNKVQLNDQQTANYRWMIIQPYMTFDNYAMALLTEKQIKTLTKMAEELPRLLVYIDGKDYDKSPKEETEKLEGVLSEYFLKSYLNTLF